MTVRATEILASAQLVLFDHRVAAAFVQSLTVPGARLHLIDDLTSAQLAQLANDAVSDGEVVVRLLSGDGLVSGRLVNELLACSTLGLRYEVVPGVALAATAVFAGVPLIGEGSTGLHIVDVRSQSAPPDIAADLGATVVLIGSGHEVTSSLDRLIGAGKWPPSTPVTLIVNGATADQRTALTSANGAYRSIRRMNLSDEQIVAILGHHSVQRDELRWFEHRPLFGWDVLVPTTREDSGDIARRVASYGGNVTYLPTVAMGSPRAPQRLDRAVQALVTGEYAWIGFTSTSAVRAVGERLREYGLDTRALAGVKVACLPGATAEAIRALGIEPDLVAEQCIVASLSEAWAKFDRNRDPLNGVLLPSADVSLDALVAGLTRKGWAVDDVQAARSMRAAPPAAEIRDAIKRGGYDAVLFQSAACVRNLLGIAGKPHARSVIASIGPATSAAATELGLRVDVESSVPEGLAAVDALAHYAIARESAGRAVGVSVTRPSQGRRVFSPDVSSLLDPEIGMQVAVSDAVPAVSPMAASVAFAEGVPAAERREADAQPKVGGRFDETALGLVRVS